MRTKDREKFLSICSEVVEGGLTKMAEERAVIMGTAGAITYLTKLKISLDKELQQCYDQKAHQAHIIWISSFREQIKRELKLLKDSVGYEEQDH